MSDPLGPPSSSPSPPDDGARRQRAVPELRPPVAADVVVVGSGLAGLTAALALAGRRVVLLTKGELARSGSSPWAQGGVAVALAPEDSPAHHAADTLAVSGGIGDRQAVAALTSDGPARVRWLIELGARFDREAGGGLAFAREAAHRHRRILHAGGDATGAEIVRALVEAVRRAPWIQVEEHVTAAELLVRDGRGIGVLARQAAGALRAFAAGAVVLATGGIGQLYARTTNPPEVTGDGLAMAARAGALMADLELVQFHPTALAAGGDPLPLLTEALRGEGAVLRDDEGERFMLLEHADAELAPRDVLARAIGRRVLQGQGVWLDAREAVGVSFPERFPTVWAHCQERALDPRVELLPVTPAAHYHMGGVAVDLAGRSTLPGLWACGEVASVGAHGANRLASNSLLEALVFGQRVAEDVQAAALPGVSSGAVWRAAREAMAGLGPPGAEPAGLRQRLRELMWRHVGLERTGRGLEQAVEALEELERACPGASGEIRSLLTVARAVALAALERRESRGAHHRLDFPEAAPEWQCRSFWTLDELEERWQQGRTGELPGARSRWAPTAFPELLEAREARP
jgi:L-aspartate oxidase